METEPWNKTNISCPGAISTVQIPFDGSTDTLVTRLVKNCDKLLKLLQSKVLQTEVRVLYSLLYVLNNSFRQHFPFRAIKQVEQCINRLKEMKLEAVLLDLREMCPTKIQREVGKKFGQCEVPSQPMLEWLSLKVLGACKLMICLTERCTRAFRGQHLHWGEFIVLNVVLTSMLSRLWAFSQGIVWTLAPLYEKTLALLQEVSRAKPMPFLSDFTLPTDAAAFLGPSYTVRAGAEPEPRGAAGVKGTSGLGKLNRKFRAEGRTRKRKGKLSRRSDRADMGSVVLQRRPEVTGHPGGLDIKAMLKRPYGRDRQFVLGVPCGLETPKRKHPSQEVAVIGQKKSFLKRARAVASSGDMAAHLAEMIGWFKGRKLRSESGRLRLLQLKCDRLRRLESQGFRVSRKLKRLRGEVSGALLLSRSVGPKRYLSLHGQWRKLHRATLSGTGRRLARRTGGGPEEEEEAAGGGGRLTCRDAAGNGKSHALRLSAAGEGDIDDIFASIGF